MRTAGEKLVMQMLGIVPIIETDLDPDLPMCKICGVRESQVTVLRWHNNLRVESDECAVCAMQPLTFEKENDCGLEINVLTSKKGIQTT